MVNLFPARWETQPLLPCLHPNGMFLRGLCLALQQGNASITSPPQALEKKLYGRKCDCSYKLALYLSLTAMDMDIWGELWTMYRWSVMLYLHGSIL